MRQLTKKSFTTVFSFSVIFASTSLSAEAVTMGAIIGPTSVSSPQGSFGGSFALSNTIDQSGLSAGYTSGVTDFDTYTASTTHSGKVSNSGFTGQETNGPQQFTFDLGSLTTINKIAIWSVNEPGAPSNFELFSDNDADFNNGTSGTLLGFTALATPSDPQPAQVFGFAAKNTQFVHINAFNSQEPPDFYGLGEVTFREVPEPLTIIGSGVVLGFGAYFEKVYSGKRKKKNNS